MKILISTKVIRLKLLYLSRFIKLFKDQYFSIYFLKNNSIFRNIYLIIDVILNLNLVKF